MSKTSIPQDVKLKLWVLSGGRCEFPGCNKYVWRDGFTYQEDNFSHMAHIIADSPNGPRGNEELSEEMAKDFGNLMLVCLDHSRLVDGRNNANYTIEDLHQYKKEHEDRIRRQTDLQPNHTTTVLRFMANIGDRPVSLPVTDVHHAILPKFPADDRGVVLNFTNRPGRGEESYWRSCADDIVKQVERELADGNDRTRPNHISIFALGPMPLLIKLGNAIGNTISVINKETAAVTSDTQYKAKLLGQTAKEVSVKGGEPVTFTAIFQNTGKAAWSEYAFSANSPSGLASLGQLSFAHELWPGSTIALKKAKAVPVDGTIREDITFRAPTAAGTYTARFTVQANGTAIEQAVSEITVHVTEGSAITTPMVSTDPALPSLAPRLAAEPRIRVGMNLVMDFVQFQSNYDDYRVLASGSEVTIIPKGQMAVVRLQSGVYTLTVGSQEFQTTDYFRFEPITDAHAPFELLNYEKRVAWKGNPNFNTYRGVFEYRQGKTDKLMYAVNDLLLEDYVAGIAETSNLAPYEYIKALLTAARTYAYVSVGKYPFFDVLASTYDQLYLGYHSEMLMPKVAEAARETRGKMVGYNGNVVITPYFANSTGQTKTWNAVWGGRTEKPWLQPVQATYDIGQPMRGHGVGMSARDAAQRAEKEGVDWMYLIQYYYTGVELLYMYQ